MPLQELEELAPSPDHRQTGNGGVLASQGLPANQGRPHSSLGPGIPEPSGGKPVPPVSGYGIPCGHRVVGIPILGGLHHEYRLEKVGLKSEHKIRNDAISCGAQE
jgi:hypothetical protein